MYTKSLEKKVKTLSREELEHLAVGAMFHLRCVSGSRNSFSSESLERFAKDGKGFPTRDPVVDAMHRQAAEFLARNDT